MSFSDFVTEIYIIMYRPIQEVLRVGSKRRSSHEANETQGF